MGEKCSLQGRGQKRSNSHPGLTPCTNHEGKDAAFGLISKASSHFHQREAPRHILSDRHHHKGKTVGSGDTVALQCDHQAATETHPRSSFWAPCPSFCSSFLSGQPSSLWILTTAVPHLTSAPSRSLALMSGYPAQLTHNHLLTSFSAASSFGL